MKVMLLGATGLTGGQVLQGLLAREEVNQVVALVRHRLPTLHDKLAQHEVDFDDLDAHASLFDVDAIICCLGTTIKKAGSQAQFRKVDLGYPLKAAELGRAPDVRAFILMSAIGASSSSTIFYNRVKGELEDALEDLGYPYLSIYHPSLLLGDRKEQRTAEALGIKAMPLVNRLLIGPLDKYRGIEAATVALAMVNEVCSLATAPAAERVLQIREYDEIRQLAE
ncbi:NAD dependent epimerase/dehydratase family protein [Marinobacter gudaonensis]|uniref:NAD dependent epimerase/dehydratase family protein n=1 Tax=Marinobacter gudaonensis TaxID=375760 RepID=A0A1I6GMV0_9GAMM|nr:NAD(P)H-binding protein [Marinobacter gudaonensis]SFR43520.1 NAD dependent epimerase/dehydratase family protein [Marinobacter gudaonensis]